MQDISEYTYLSCVLCHVPHDHNDLPFEILKHHGVRALAELSLGGERSAERDVDAACDVTSEKADRGAKESGLFLSVFGVLSV